MRHVTCDIVTSHWVLCHHVRQGAYKINMCYIVFWYENRMKHPKVHILATSSNFFQVVSLSVYIIGLGSVFLW